MTAFKRALQVCGLSQREAADFFDVSINTVKSWCSERRTAPDGVWLMLADLFEQIQGASEGALETMMMDGVDVRSFYNVSADTINNELPIESTREVAGVMALLIAISETQAERMREHEDHDRNQDT